MHDARKPHVCRDHHIWIAASGGHGIAPAEHDIAPAHRMRPLESFPPVPLPPFVGDRGIVATVLAVFLDVLGCKPAAASRPKSCTSHLRGSNSQCQETTVFFVLPARPQQRDSSSGSSSSSGSKHLHITPNQLHESWILPLCRRSTYAHSMS